MVVLDSDHFSVLTDARHAHHRQLVERLHATTEPVALPIIVVEEQMRAWLAQLRRVHDVRKQVYVYDRWLHLLKFVADWDIVPWTERAAENYLQIRHALRRIGTQDLKIASIALAHGATLLSANLRDFERVPGLRAEDWLRE